MGYILPPGRPLMRGESREHWYLERKAELEEARNKMPTVSFGIFLVLAIFLGIGLLYFLIS